MKMTSRIIKDFEALSTEALLELGYSVKVRVISYYEDKEGFITKTPWFEVAYLHAYHDRLDSVEGTWWVEVDGVRHSLQDYNVVPNNYNSNSITVY